MVLGMLRSTYPPSDVPDEVIADDVVGAVWKVNDN